MKNALLGLLVASALGAQLTHAAEPAGVSGDEPGSDTKATTPVYKSATVLSVPNVGWPAGNTNREALVYLRIVISTEGKVSDVELVEDRGFYNDDFVRAARSLAKSYRFRPATRDGKPVPQTVVLPIAYTRGGDDGKKWATGVTDEFRVEAQKVDNLFKKGDYAGADFHAQWMLKEKVRYGYEFAVLNSMLAQTHASIGDDYPALELAERATQRTTPTIGKFALHQPVPPNNAANYLLPENVVVLLLELRMRIAARNGLLKRALEAYYELAGLVDMTPDDPRVTTAAQLTAQLESAEPLAVRGRIEEGGWIYELNRRHFTLEEVKGSVDTLTLTCNGKHQELSYVPAGDWTVPADWEDCQIRVRGEAGTMFSLIELTD